jgi:hypothetical protein
MIGQWDRHPGMHFRMRHATPHRPLPCVRPAATAWSVIAAAIMVFLAAFGGDPAAAAVPSAPAAGSPSGGELERQPTWPLPTKEDVRQRMLAWIDACGADAGARDEQRRAWADGAATAPENGTAADPLDRVMATFAILDPRCAALEQDIAGEHAWLAAAATHPFQRDAVKLWLGREFVRRDQFDDALAFLADLDVASSVDPAALLFHRAACQHWLLESDAAIETLDRLLERAGEIPLRYERLARLMRADLASLEDESLDHIARRMRDVTRRLDQGRAGPKTRRVQDGVIESLDKLIAAIEQQQQQQQQSQSGAGGGSGRGGEGKPMDDSRLADGKGAGEVTKRDLGDTEGWGNLPPHKRDEALQQIGREFPAHYREAIEQYFKRLAAGSEAP